MSLQQTIYYNSPPLIKNIIASIYGYRLYKRRYANRYFTEALPAIIERQTWSAEQLKEYQDQSVRRLIETAANHVPYYRELFQRLGLRHEDIRTCDDLVNTLPILEKSEVKSAPERFVDERLDLKRLNRIYTSGTTGTPLCVYRDDMADGLAYAYYEARWRMPYGITKDSTWAILGGKLVIPHEQSKPPFWVWNAGLRQLYMSSYHLSIECARYYLDKLKRSNLDYIYGYASSLYSLALFARELGFHDLKFKAAISNAEPL